jgi:hypothetical protein
MDGAMATKLHHFPGPNHEKLWTASVLEFLGLLQVGQMLIVPS